MRATTEQRLCNKFQTQVQSVEIVGQSTEIADDNSTASITLRGTTAKGSGLVSCRPVVITGTPRELRAMCRAGLEGLRKRKNR